MKYNRSTGRVLRGKKTYRRRGFTRKALIPRSPSFGNYGASFNFKIKHQSNLVACSLSTDGFVIVGADGSFNSSAGCTLNQSPDWDFFQGQGKFDILAQVYALYTIRGLKVTFTPALYPTVQADRAIGGVERCVFKDLHNFTVPVAGPPPTFNARNCGTIMTSMIGQDSYAMMPRIPTKYYLQMSTPIAQAGAIWNGTAEGIIGGAAGRSAFAVDNSTGTMNYRAALPWVCFKSSSSGNAGIVASVVVTVYYQFKDRKF